MIRSQNMKPLTLSALVCVTVQIFWQSNPLSGNGAAARCFRTENEPPGMVMVVRKIMVLFTIWLASSLLGYVGSGAAGLLGGFGGEVL